MRSSLVLVTVMSIAAVLPSGTAPKSITGGSIVIEGTGIPTYTVTVPEAVSPCPSLTS